MRADAGLGRKRLRHRNTISRICHGPDMGKCADLRRGVDPGERVSILLILELGTLTEKYLLAVGSTELDNVGREKGREGRRKVQLDLDG